MKKITFRILVLAMAALLCACSGLHVAWVATASYNMPPVNLLPGSGGAQQSAQAMPAASAASAPRPSASVAAPAAPTPAAAASAAALSAAPAEAAK